MVGSGQSWIRPIEFSSSIHESLPVEVIERSDLMRRVPKEHFTLPERPSFHSFLLVHSGRGVHTVDFVETLLVPGRLVRVLPGQVQIWDTKSAVDATLVLSQLVPLHLSEDVAGDAYRDLDQNSMSTAQALVGVLRGEQAQFDGEEASTRLMRTLFEALCCVFDRAAGEQTVHLPEAYAAFAAAVEDNLGDAHTVRELANNLGYSERTVTRACQKVTGRSARDFLNERIVLEAKRMLAHTDEPASTIAAELGFSEATNFHKFFFRHTGKRPIEFRRRHRRVN